ncbi:hypothetical protein BBJ28_00013463 [Nothophytophthora sp. Chile5]|nr:hypothetical protein BBJ28_00013463 [Nothophytophthora sp. Chile5]
MQTSQVYAVDRVYGDLQPQFVAKDVLKALSQLDAVVGDVFNRLAHQVTQEKQRLAAVDGRIRVCQAKVNALTERRASSKPTTVFSTSKYPAPRKLPLAKSLFHDKPYADAPPLVPDADDDTHFLPAEPLPPAQRGQHMTEVVELFEKVNVFQKTQQPEADMEKEGLGRLPEYIPSVGSVLLFNSGENPYQKYTSWDNLLGTDYEEEEEKRKELAKAPRTIEYGDELPSVHGLNYEFHPSMGIMPEMSAKLPTNLPGLANIADYKYAQEGDANTSIAPSMFQDKTLPDLPPVASFAEGPVALEPSDQNFQVGPVDGPPPPPPPASTVDFTKVEDGAPPLPPPPQGDDEDDSMPPPPPPMVDGEDEDAPPPPPPLQEDGPPAPPAPPAPEAEDEAPQAVSLLDQIRNPTIKLRAVKADDKKPEASEKAAAAKPLTIAEEMQQRMLRRQAAISGKQDQMEQRREREKAAAKPVAVLTAKEVTAPVQPPPPPPPSEDGQRNKLPTVAMSDDGSDDGRGLESDDDKSNDGDDFLAQIRNIKKKQDAEGPPSAQPKPKPSPTQLPKAQEAKNPVADFESQMVGLRNREDSLSMSEASDWSDD